MPIVTIGQYLKHCRLRAGMTTLDVALRVDTVPAVCAMIREALVVGIEAGLVPVQMEAALAWAAIPELRIDPDTAARLVDQQSGPVAVRIIRTRTLAEAMPK
ncbi:hypothetical protein QE361_003162 [Sphingomonas sp. SORGH_AS802]|uniref:hypothetical protein n=1 Tax=unclassified Sphingomonas TaxID=196159 RepID=UPI002860F1A3|nr:MULTISPECIES: hypothetical protein [unclassified Sphingomonas]MDR6128826.1 hypothetical protein [Sphingomonas sp. SORGH_AS_0438]MDR6136161.1 hypothetical protein [Sphingomonas sp. SORGH_AS_0802]